MLVKVSAGQNIILNIIFNSFAPLTYVIAAIAIKNSEPVFVNISFAIPVAFSFIKPILIKLFCLRIDVYDKLTTLH